MKTRKQVSNSQRILDQHTANSNYNFREARTGLIFLIIWLGIPLLVLSLAKTRHEWYAVQMMPPLAILLAWWVLKVYESIRVCGKCGMVRYLAEISMGAFVLASILSVLVVEDPSTPAVKAARWLRQNTRAETPAYVYQWSYLPETLLFKPQETEVVNDESLTEVLKNEAEVKVFVRTLDEGWFRSRFESLKVAQDFEWGKVYQNH